jgi:ATP-binding cassette subfamily B protein
MTRQMTKKVHSRSLVRRMISLVGPLWPVEYRAIACGTIQHLVSVAAVSCAAVSIVRAAYTPQPFSEWIGWAIAAALLLLIRGLFSYGEQLFNHQMAFSTLRDIRTSVFDQMRKLAPAKLEGAGRGNLVTVLTQDIERLEIFYAHTLSPLAIAALCSLIYTIAISFTSPLLGLLALISYALIGIGIPLVFTTPTARQSQTERTQQGLLRSHFLESLDSGRMIHNFGAEEKVGQDLSTSADRMIRARAREQRLTGTNSLAADALMLCSILAFTVLSLHLTVSGQMSLTAALVSLAGFAVSFPPVLSVARLGSGLQPTFAAAHRVFALMDETPSVLEVPNGQGQSISALTSLEARDLNFSYPHSSPVLSGLNLTIHPGDVIGIEGPNGAGKTTFLDVLLRFRDRTSGKLAINGIPLEHIETTSLRKLETLAAQSTFIFSDTLAANIALAKPDASRSEIQQAAHRACLGDVIDQLDGGLDHVLIRHGAELSEGQKQRIAVARALLSDAPLVLLDEPTSNMDALLEGEVLRSLLSRNPDDRGAHTDHTAYVIVTHHASVLRAIRQVSGKIFTLRDGSLHEQ